jgi:hypothetical protein
MDDYLGEGPAATAVGESSKRKRGRALLPSELSHTPRAASFYATYQFNRPSAFDERVQLFVYLFFARRA